MSDEKDSMLALETHRYGTSRSFECIGESLEHPDGNGGYRQPVRGSGLPLRSEELKAEAREEGAQCSPDVDKRKSKKCLNFRKVW